MAEVRFENVSCRYAAARHPAVSDLDLTLADGELLALCGAPESGKSTVLRLLAGLVPVTSGRILVGQHEVTDPAAPPVVLLFQNYALYPNLSVAQNIALPLTQEGMDKRMTADRTAEVAELVGLTGLLRRGGGTLTAGERIRVGLARALVREPAALLMDEPLANLQPDIRDEVAELLVTAQRIRKITTVYATADADEALAIGDRVALLEAGVLREVVVPSTFDPAGQGQRAAREE